MMKPKHMCASEYLELFKNLNVNRSGTKTAPHKAILLLTVIKLIEDDIINTPYIPLSEKLINEFNSIWAHYISKSSGFSCKLNYPFFHLSTSPFWTLNKRPSYIEMKEYSMTALKRSFYGASLSKDLFDLLLQSDFRKKIKNILISTYICDNDITSYKSVFLVTIVMLLIA